MASAQGLDGFLGRDDSASGGGEAAPAPEPVTQEAEKVEQSATTAPADAAQATEAEPNDHDPNDPAEQTPQQRAGLRKALEQERKRRQEHERKLAELEGKLSAFSTLTAKPNAPAQPDAEQEPDFYSGPEKYIETREQRLMAAFNARLAELSADAMRAAHPDYDEAEKAFLEAVQHNPALAQQLRASGNPARFAYEHGKAYQQLRGLGSIDELTNRIRQEERAKIEAEFRQKGALAAASQASTSSAGARSAGAQSPVVTGETPIGEILRGR